MKIESTTDYKVFKYVLGNRAISKKKVQRLVEDVKNGLNLFPYCPIIVSDSKNGTLNIIDGQHRLQACKEMNLPIYYVVAEDIDLRDIARMNSKTDKWKFSDFVECYIKLGIKDYQVFKDFQSKYRLNYAPAIGLLSTGSPMGHEKASVNFKDGNFKVTQLEEAKKMMDLVSELFDRYKFCRDRHLIEAVARLEKKSVWEVSRFAEKLDKNPNMMEQCASIKTYILLIEQIYNKNSQHRKIIY